MLGDNGLFKPLRNLSYDMGEYEKQAAKIRRKIRRGIKGNTQINKFGNIIIIIILLIMFTLLFGGCGSKTKQINAEPNETVSEEEQEIDLTKLLSAVNDCVISYCSSECILTPFVQCRLPDASLTDDISSVDKDSLEDNLLTIYVMFQIPKEGNNLENMATQHYIQTVVDISIFEVLSL